MWITRTTASGESAGKSGLSGRFGSGCRAGVRGAILASLSAAW